MPSHSKHTCCKIGRNDMLGLCGRYNGRRGRLKQSRVHSQDGNSSARRNSRKLRHCPRLLEALLSSTPAFPLQSEVLVFYSWFSAIITPSRSTSVSPYFITCFALSGAGLGHADNVSYSARPAALKAPHRKLLDLTSTIYLRIIALRERRPMTKHCAVSLTRSIFGRTSRSNEPRIYQSGPDWFRTNT
jgi:hypothetical protein